MQSPKVTINENGKDIELTGDEALFYIQNQEALAQEVAEREAAINELKESRINIFKKLGLSDDDLKVLGLVGVSANEA